MFYSKMTCALLCLLLIGQSVDAVINKASAQATVSNEEEKKTEAKADDRISNIYGPASDEYCPPSGGGFNGQLPVYGPPELVGDHGPSPVFPPLPPDQPPAFVLPASFYGPPRNIKPHGPSKPIFGGPKPGFGPPKLHFGPPKQVFGPPLSFGSFRPPKPQYGTPLKLNSVIPPQFPGPIGQHGLSKPGQGPTIPISLETYGPPLPKPVIQFHPLPKDEFGHPPPPAPIPHGPVGDLYGPPPLAPPPGVPAPPTPPDIKYDGWQPIAGVTQQGPPSHTYGSPDAYHGIPDSVAQNANLPSDSYGVPIHNPEAQDLKTSVRESSQSEHHGLPPPPLPQYEPLHNQDQRPPKKDSPPKFNPHPQPPNPEYGVPGVEPLSIVKTVGFELLPSPGALTSGGQDVQNQLTHSGPDHGLQISGHDHSIPNHGPSSGGNDLSLQHLSISGPSNIYGPPGPPPVVGKSNAALPGVHFHPPQQTDTYSVPPLSSYSPNGPYPASQGGRAAPSFPSFGFHGGFHRHGPFRQHGGFRPPLSPPGALIPPRNRDPIKFREPIPTGLLTNLHQYPSRPHDLQKVPKLHGPPLAQQLPNINAPNSFHPPSFGGFPPGGPFKRPNLNLNSAVAAPHAQYGTPLSFVDFNTPAPGLTYGAPNFGPPSSFGSTTTGHGNNLYNNVGNTLTYGTPVVGDPGSAPGRDRNYPQLPSAVYGPQDIEHRSPNVEPAAAPAPVVNIPSSLPASHASDAPKSLLNSIQADQPPGPAIDSSLPTSLSPPAPPPVETLSVSIPNPPPPPQDVAFFNPVPAAHPGASDAGFPQHQGLLSLAVPNQPIGPSHEALLLTPLQPTQTPNIAQNLEPIPLNPHPPSQSFIGPQDQGIITPTPPTHFRQDQPLLTLSTPGQSHGDSSPNQPTTTQINQGELFKVAVQAVTNTLGGVPVAPQVNHLNLQSFEEQQKTDLKDSYGNPIGITFQPTDQLNNDFLNSRNLLPPTAPVETFSGPPSSQPHVIFTPEQLTATLTMQGFAQPKSLAGHELDASQFLRTNEGSQALSLTQSLTANGPDGFQIQGSKGTYMLQIQPADGGLGTENSDGNIRHDQVLSNGLLQDILAAIEQPDQGRVQESLHGVLGNLQQPAIGFVPAEHFIKNNPDAQKKNFNAADRSDISESLTSSNPSFPLGNGPVALFFNNQFSEALKEMRSVSKSESHATASANAEKSVSKTKTS